ncbi:MAG TPA: TIR domain-containing protein [Acidimicrobiales bacterium]
MTTGPGLRVFFSHSSRDAEWVKRVAAQAVAAGVEVYLAEHDVQAGRHLSDKIRAEIRASDAMIVLLSPNSLESVIVQQEIGVAHQAEMLVIPILMEEVASKDLGLLNGREYVLLNPADPHEGLARISVALIRLIDKQREQLQAEDIARLERERQQQAEALAKAYAQMEAQQRKTQQDMLVAGAVLLVIGLIIIAGQSGS